ncbi:unnamed protein product [Polarella glacialis]|uniref:Uncharacterized protein n=1 Tax=Polarella glacialis TaxID=89957 RepID=A0A813EIK1_POLGL|nr:unnamed protein product [Polarella glacialis]
MKAALSRFGETVVEEQVFMQHLFSIPLLFPCQWSKVGPRFLDWYNRGNLWLVFYLCAQIFLASWSRSAAAKMAGRSPNLLMTQLVQTLESLLQLLTVTMLLGRLRSAAAGHSVLSLCLRAASLRAASEGQSRLR